MRGKIDQTNFNDLRSIDSQNVVHRTGCKYFPDSEKYKVGIWGENYCVDLKANKIIPDNPGEKTYHDFLYLFILFYLMKSQRQSLSNEWISEKDITGGSTFFRGPHTIPTDKITRRFGDNLSLFEKRCDALDGKKINFADAAFAFEITPTIKVAVLYFQGDAEFESKTRLLFDKTITQHLPLDIIFALAVVICHRLSEA